MTSSRCLAAAGVGAASFATCIYAVIDPSGGASKIVQAGHLPPVLVLPDGTTQVLDLPPGLPLLEPPPPELLPLLVVPPLLPPPPPAQVTGSQSAGTAAGVQPGSLVCGWMHS